MSFKKLPYGISNFADLIEDGYAYVDKTRFIEYLENENGRYQFFVRPRRFGKSLFLSVLENYYDINKKDKFETLFGNLYIGKNSTPEQGKYAVIQFDFSGLDVRTHEIFRKSFLDRVQEVAALFFDRYKDILSVSQTSLDALDAKTLGLGAIDLIYRATTVANVGLFVIIDEYDSFANNLIAMGEAYKKETEKESGVVRAFYELLKAGTKSVVKRMFATGISPMMATDLTSGFNIAANLSLFAKYNEMFGFTREEVEWIIDETNIDRNLIEVDMETYYNGYLFDEDGENKVYNSQMVLFFFNQIKISGRSPKEIVDTNLKTDSGRLERLAGSERNREKLLQIIRDGGIFGNVISSFSQNQLENEEYFVSLLFYLGMLTIDKVVEGQTYLKIPNYSIKTLYWEYVIFYAQAIEKGAVNKTELIQTIRDMAYRCDFKSFLDFFTEHRLKLLSNRDLTSFDEKYIKSMMLATVADSGLYHPISENENIGGYSDIYFQKHHSVADIKFEYVFELKYVKTGASKSEKDKKFSDAAKQIEKYKKDPRFANRSNLKFVAIVFQGKGDYEAKEL
ncbi:MAG: ATP-binding protein [Chitinivibrionia bacterium]|nr:ATP-binding protein [Chitinivibrionia bacterium]